MKRTKTRKPKAANWKPLLFLIVVVVVINATAFYFAYRRPNAQATVPRIPHYFATAEAAKPLPRTLEPTGFSNREVVAAYSAAKKIPKVLAQQPCSCHCDRKQQRLPIICLRVSFLCAFHESSLAVLFRAAPGP